MTLTPAPWLTALILAFVGGTLLGLGRYTGGAIAVVIALVFMAGWHYERSKGADPWNGVR